MAHFHSPRIVTDGLVLALDAANTKSYPGSGTVWTDLSGNGYNFTLTNGPTFTFDNPSNISFDGVDDRASQSTLSSFFLDPLTESITISIWLYIPSVATWSNGNRGSIIGKGGFAGSFGLVRQTTDNVIQFWIRGITSGSGGAQATISRDTWVYVTGTWSNPTSTLYINGAFSNSAAVSPVGGLNNATYFIGNAISFSGSSGNQFQGSIAYMKFYNRALTAQEIQQNYNATKGRYGL
jgi:hypothetical protein